MTRYIYYPPSLFRGFYHPGIEKPITITNKQAALYLAYSKRFYVYNPTTGKPIRMSYWKTNEDWLLFHTYQDCINYYKEGMQ